MSQTKKLSDEEIKEIFINYDINKDNSINKTELKNLVGFIYQKNNNITELGFKDKFIIRKSVDELLRLKDVNKDGSLGLDEFLSHYNGQNIFETTENVLSNNRIFVYSNRIGFLMKNINMIKEKSKALSSAHEVGETAKKFIPEKILIALTGITYAYVLMDTFVKTNSVRNHGKEKMFFYFLDTSIFHLFASLALPGFTISSTLKISNFFFSKFLKPQTLIGRFGPTIFSMACLPFILHPLDKFCEIAMDNSLRKLYEDKLLCEHHGHHLDDEGKNQESKH